MGNMKIYKEEAKLRKETLDALKDYAPAYWSVVRSECCKLVSSLMDYMIERDIHEEVANDGHGCNMLERYVLLAKYSPVMPTSIGDILYMKDNTPTDVEGGAEEFIRGCLTTAYTWYDKIM